MSDTEHAPHVAHEPSSPPALSEDDGAFFNTKHAAHDTSELVAELGLLPPGGELAALFSQTYGRLHELAYRRCRTAAGSMLQPTALVHEVYVRLASRDPVVVRDAEHLLAVAATVMRQVLIDRSRRQRTIKRGGDCAHVPLNEESSPCQVSAVDLVALGRAITRLLALHPRQGRIVELRVLTGLTVPEVARSLRLSTATVEKSWRRARAWLRGELAGDP
ncbi:MAG: ECF-type sigma factor [Kofleriaceae bacterium]